MQTIANKLPVAVVMHWTMQGILYADPTEKAFRICVDLLLTAIGTVILLNWVSWPLALMIAFVVAHTINFLTNAQLCALARDFGLVQISPDDFLAHVQGIKERAEREPSVRAIAVCGGLGREHLHPGSDLDARVMRYPGFMNGIRAAFFLMQERSRALFQWFPLDMYLFDDDRALVNKLKKDEVITWLYIDRELAIDRPDILKVDVSFE